MYFSSQVLMMKMNLPESRRQVLTRVLGKLDYTWLQRWFDWIFLIVALGSLGGVWIKERDRRQETKYLLPKSN